MPDEQGICPKCGEDTYWRPQPPRFLKGVALKISIDGRVMEIEVTEVKEPDWVCGSCGHKWKS